MSAQHPDYHITVTGHCLGGALAGIAYPILTSSTSLPIKGAITFGEFRTGNAAWANFIELISNTTEDSIGNYIRMTHSNDGVPNTPLQTQGFQHSRTEIFELDNVNITQTAQTTYRCFGREAEDCNVGVAVGIVNRAHLNYTGIVMTNGAQCRLSRGAWLIS
jgi:hypothetical protein